MGSCSEWKMFGINGKRGGKKPKSHVSSSKLASKLYLCYIKKDILYKTRKQLKVVNFVLKLLSDF